MNESQRATDKFSSSIMVSSRDQTQTWQQVPGLVNHFAGPEGFIHYVCLYLRRLKEGIGSTELELQVIVSCLMWVLGT